MPIRDEEKFESYLKQFRPVAPEPLVAEEPTRARRRPLVCAAWAAAAAVVLVAAVIAWHFHSQPSSPRNIATDRGANVEELINPQPLTIRGANALLASAPSFKAAVDRVAFQSEFKPVSQGRHSALAVLSEEKSKL